MALCFLTVFAALILPSFGFWPAPATAATRAFPNDNASYSGLAWSSLHDLAGSLPEPDSGTPPFTLLYAFSALGSANGNTNSDGAEPYAPLTVGPGGDFYGTTYFGGTDGYGTVFKLTPSGTFTTLYSFVGSSDGAYPQAALVVGPDGNFYGTTSMGGAHGYGTVFRLTPSGTFTTLHSLTDGSDGADPDAALVAGSDGNFYGTASIGGASSHGTVFKMTPSGTFTTLHSFTDGSDGADPNAALVAGSDGDFYGTASIGGTHGYGTVFKITSSGTFTTLYSFTGGSDGANPDAALVVGHDGNFYGTTDTSSAGGYGTVFKLTPSGTFTTLYTFTDGDDGANPDAALVVGPDGNFYGTAYFGGMNGDGTVFEVTSGGVFASLYSFTDGSDGADPDAALVVGSDGDFYGTASMGGKNDEGTLFRLTADPGTGGAPSLTSFTPASGSAGTVVTLTGANLSGVTAINFHDALAKTFSANAQGTQITVTVPSGALTGTIKVTTPAGSALTTTQFSVAGVPAITSFTPSSGPVGTVVTINGANLNGVTAVRFHDASAANFSANAQGTQLTVSVPSGALTGTITVTTPSGAVATATQFTVTAGSLLPTITSFTPASGPVGTVVTINGTNLKGVTAVRFHDASATKFSANAQGTQITVSVPSGALTGTITVTTPAGSVPSKAQFTVTP